MDLVGEGPCERVVVFIVSMVFVCLDSCRFNQKGNRKRGIGIFNVFSYIYHRVLFWKGFPISMDKLLHQLVLVNGHENAAIISCNDGIFMDLLLYQLGFLDFAIRSKALQHPSFLISHGQKLLRHHCNPCGSCFFEFEEGKGHQKCRQRCKKWPCRLPLNLSCRSTTVYAI